MAIDFPGSPSPGDTYVVGSVTYTWDGTKWTATTPAAQNQIIQGNTSAVVTDTGSDGRLVVTTEGTERFRIGSNGLVTVKNGAVAEIGTLTDAATITPDFSANCNFTVTLGGNRTMGNPTNITAGQTGSIFIVQDGSGNRTLTWNSYWDFVGGTAPVLSTASGAIDRVDYVVRTSTSIHTVFTANYS